MRLISRLRRCLVMAPVGVMHGIVQGQTARAFAARGACMSQQRQEITPALPFRRP